MTAYYRAVSTVPAFETLVRARRMAWFALMRDQITPIEYVQALDVAAAHYIASIMARHLL